MLCNMCCTRVQCAGVGRWAFLRRRPGWLRVLLIALLPGNIAFGPSSQHQCVSMRIRLGSRRVANI